MSKCENCEKMKREHARQRRESREITDGLLDAIAREAAEGRRRSGRMWMSEKAEIFRQAREAAIVAEARAMEECGG